MKQNKPKRSLKTGRGFFEKIEIVSNMKQYIIY